MTESLRTRLERLGFDLFPAYRFGGGRVTYIREDWREVHVEVPLNWRTRNYVGTTFGGSMYAAVDPIYMLVLIRNLGRAYTVWDRAASISFERPVEARSAPNSTSPSRRPTTSARRSRRGTPPPASTRWNSSTRTARPVPSSRRPSTSARTVPKGSSGGSVPGRDSERLFPGPSVAGV